MADWIKKKKQKQNKNKAKLYTIYTAACRKVARASVPPVLGPGSPRGKPLITAPQEPDGAMAVFGPTAVPRLWNGWTFSLCC